MLMKIDTTLTISRNSKDKICIQVRDETSRNNFVTISISLEDFAFAITGLSEIKCSAEVKRLDIVGKYKVRENRSVVCPIDTYDKNILSQWLANNCQEQGWELDTYLGSQKSVQYKDNFRILNYSVVKYVKENTNEI